MRYHDDMSYINQNLVERGLMRVVPYSIRLDRFFTEEEMTANRKCAESCNASEWSARCDEIRQRVAVENLNLLRYLQAYFRDMENMNFASTEVSEDNVKSYNNTYAAWLWCNDLSNTTNSRMSGNDYSYITLTLEKEKNIEKNEYIFAKVKELLADYPAKNIQAIFQYSQVKMVENVAKEADRIFNLCKGKYINYGGFTGKLERFQGDYIFKKKNAKKYFYKVSPMDICINVSE